jgi:hypothetical protein
MRFFLILGIMTICFMTFSQNINYEKLDSLLRLNYETSFSKGNIPKGVNNAVRTFTGYSFRISNANNNTPKGDLGSIKEMKKRRLIFFAWSSDFYVLGYEHGGRAHHKHFIFLKKISRTEVIYAITVIGYNPKSIRELLAILNTNAVSIAKPEEM